MQVQQRFRDTFFAILTDETYGVNAQLAAIATREGVTIPQIPDTQIFKDSIDADLFDGEDDALPYPHLFIDIPQDSNTEQQKYSYNSGPAQVGTEIRVSIPGTQGGLIFTLATTLDYYVEAVINSIIRYNLNWGQYGIQLPGTYSTQYAPVRRGADNYIKIARITWDAWMQTALPRTAFPV